MSCARRSATGTSSRPTTWSPRARGSPSAAADSASTGSPRRKTAWCRYPTSSAMARQCRPRPAVDTQRVRTALPSSVRMTTVLISVPHGFSAGNMLRTGLVRRLLETAPDVEVVLLSPLVDDGQFVKEFDHPRVRFEPLAPHRPAGLEARLLALIQASYVDAGVTEAVRIRRQEAVARKTMR